MRGPEKIGRFLLILAGMLITLPSTAYAQAGSGPLVPASGRPLSAEGIIPADVLARVELLRNELELIRFEMGQAKVQPIEIAVSDASPREVIFQAITLFRKMNQLSFEMTGDPGPQLVIRLPRPPEEIRPYHVWRVVDGAYQHLLALKEQLGITQPIEEKLQDASTTPTDVFHAIAEANRQLALLLKLPPSSGDVFHQVTVATYLAARLLEQFPGATPMPAAPAFEAGKRPVDVYNRLVQCYARVRAIGEQSGVQTMKLEMVDLEATVGGAAQIKPSDVYDMAILLVSELVYLHARVAESEAPAASYEPGLKLPAHAYQRAGLLLRQLRELEEHAAASPDWLTSAR